MPEGQQTNSLIFVKDGDGTSSNVKPTAPKADAAAAFADRVGKLHPSYFNQLFKKHKGITPVGYRKALQ
ncbi:AraC family transcriptional regulator [Paenibacillus shunpengii]|uniref:AraC family transcriptional regulator n=1 Tax=Paenibacillus shunpengii TaxID=2054424 RepID=A0ABW5SM27_9BACL|nr:AraC family transcriptional regulator [Paenibacillus sp. FSL H7-0326]OMC67612.1 hypothetical protein BK126_18775 [Paenibacillus sp. FSL H7-0326]